MCFNLILFHIHERFANAGGVALIDKEVRPGCVAFLPTKAG
jgi:hypothetical protein